ncbi:hypothetical protein C8F04DRAFT_1330926 [Mycena alexandri]|uniref:Uncharacterized protein n=1 Tax=Mycena alexandri TaxID=1745969 RepID=A0AAD6T577_9AGAR|nr:hypothetical protein C8F04DRAFT_1330926 [Mycena alexandri]
MLIANTEYCFCGEIPMPALCSACGVESPYRVEFPDENSTEKKQRKKLPGMPESCYIASKSTLYPRAAGSKPTWRLEFSSVGDPARYTARRDGTYSGTPRSLPALAPKLLRIAPGAHQSRISNWSLSSISGTAACSSAISPKKAPIRAVGPRLPDTRLCRNASRGDYLLLSPVIIQRIAHDDVQLRTGPSPAPRRQELARHCRKQVGKETGMRKKTYLGGKQESVVELHVMYKRAESFVQDANRALDLSKTYMKDLDNFRASVDGAVGGRDRRLQWHEHGEEDN